ncbi:hypothetical protein [Corynebacterium mastitidis]
MSHVHNGCSHLHGAVLHRPTSINAWHDAEADNHPIPQEDAA